MARAGPIMTAFTALAILYIGWSFLFAPEAAAAGYGLIASARGDAAPYLAAKGARDLSYGVLLIVLLAAQQRRALGLVLIVAAMIPAIDAVIVLRSGGSDAVALGIHLPIVLWLAANGALVLRGSRIA